MRIISLVPSQTELLFDLGLEDCIVGCTRFCIHPLEKTRAIPKIGGTKDFDFEKIEALNPTLILGNKEENFKEGIETLQAKYNVWISDILNLQDALEMILKVGDLTRKADGASNLVANIQKQFDNHLSLINESVSVAYFIWKKPLMVAGKNTFIDDMLVKMGLQNVFKNTSSRYPEIDEKILKQANPKIILLSSEPYPFNERHITYFQEICPEATIKIVDGELFSWYGSRLLKTPQYLAQLQKEFV